MLQLLGDPSINSQPNAETFETFQDLDLIVLGADGVNYRQYIEQIQKEYPHMDDASYKEMRSRVTHCLYPIAIAFVVNESFLIPFPDIGNIFDNTPNLFCTIHTRQIRSSSQIQYQNRNNGVEELIYFLSHCESKHTAYFSSPHFDVLFRYRCVTG